MSLVDMDEFREQKRKANMLKRRRLAVLEDESASSAASGAAAGVGIQDEFVLPSCDESESSSSLSSQEEEDHEDEQQNSYAQGAHDLPFEDPTRYAEEHHEPSLHQRQDASSSPRPQNEEELLEAAFFAPMPFPLQQQHNQDDQYDDTATAHHPAPLTRHVVSSNRQPAEMEVVDLCSDDDNDGDADNEPTMMNRPTAQAPKPHSFSQPRRAASNTAPKHRNIVHEGLRSPPSESASFGVQSRAALRRPEAWHQSLVSSQHATSPRRILTSVPTDREASPNPEDDIVECWSSDDDIKHHTRSARRVTDHQFVLPASRSRGAFPPSSSFQHQPTHADDDNENVPPSSHEPAAFVPAPSRHRRPTTASTLSQEHQQRRRIRNSAAFNPSNAGSVVVRGSSSNVSSSSSFLPAPSCISTNDDRYRQRMAPPAATSYQYSRGRSNDLVDASEAAIAGYNTFASFQDGGQATTARTSTTTARRAASSRTNSNNTKRSTSRAGNAKKKKSWGGKKYYKRKKGGNGKRKQQGGGRRGRRAASSLPDYSRRDTDLGHVGGAEIKF